MILLIQLVDRDFFEQAPFEGFPAGSRHFSGLVLELEL